MARVFKVETSKKQTRQLFRPGTRTFRRGTKHWRNTVLPGEHPRAIWA